MRAILTVIVAVNLFGTAANAAPAPSADDSISAASLECSRIEDREKRLDCADRVADKYMPGGSWTVRESISRMDDKKNVVLTVTAINVLRAMFRDKFREMYGDKDKVRHWDDKFHLLQIRCIESTTSVLVGFGGRFMSDHAGGGSVTYRIDQQPAKTQSFSVSNDNKALGLWSGGSSIPFIKKLFGAEKLLIRAAPFRENALTDEFNVAGLEEAIKPLRTACGW